MDPHVKAIIVLFVGVLAAVVAVAGVLPPDSDELTNSLASNAAFVVVGLLGVWVMGRGAFRKSLADPPSPRFLLLGLIAGGVAFAFSWTYVESLAWLIGIGDFGLRPDTPSLELIVALAVLPALVEEWTDRGVLWVAMRPFVSERKTIVVTAIVFAFMHGLGGGFLLELPHRFVAGLVFGWLRARSGSLVPGMVAHFVHNVLSLVF